MLYIFRKPAQSVNLKQKNSHQKSIHFTYSLVLFLQNPPQRISKLPTCLFFSQVSFRIGRVKSTASSCGNLGSPWRSSEYHPLQIPYAIVEPQTNSIKLIHPASCSFRVASVASAFRRLVTKLHGDLRAFDPGGSATSFRSLPCDFPGGYCLGNCYSMYYNPGGYLVALPVTNLSFAVSQPVMCEATTTWNGNAPSFLPMAAGLSNA